MSGTTNREMDEHQPILVPRGNATFLADKLRFSLFLLSSQTKGRLLFVLSSSSNACCYYYYYYYFRNYSPGKIDRSSSRSRDRGAEAGSWKRKVARAAKRNPPSERCFVEIQMTAPPNSWRLFEGRCTGDYSWRRRRKGWSNTNLARTWSFNI